MRVLNQLLVTPVFIVCYLTWLTVVQNAGAIIGKGGSNINKLRQAVSARYCCVA